MEGKKRGGMVFCSGFWVVVVYEIEIVYALWWRILNESSVQSRACLFFCCMLSVATYLACELVVAIMFAVLLDAMDGDVALR